MFDFGLKPVFAVENFVVTFKPNGTKGDATTKVPNFDMFAKFLLDPFPKQRFFPIETIMVASPYPTKLV
jgi:hypothetical protein